MIGAVFLGEPSAEFFNGTEMCGVGIEPQMRMVAFGDFVIHPQATIYFAKAMIHAAKATIRIVACDGGIIARGSDKRFSREDVVDIPRCVSFERAHHLGIIRLRRWLDQQMHMVRQHGVAAQLESLEVLREP